MSESTIADEHNTVEETLWVRHPKRQPPSSPHGEGDAAVQLVVLSERDEQGGEGGKSRLNDRGTWTGSRRTKLRRR